MNPIVILSKPNSLLMTGAAADMFTRSRYEMKYIKQIRNNTNQRFLLERLGSPFIADIPPSATADFDASAVSLVLEFFILCSLGLAAGPPSIVGAHATHASRA